MKKNIIIYIIILVVISLTTIFFLPNFLLDNFGECHAENGACCKKLGSLFTCVYVGMTCEDENEEPVWKGCDNDCKHIIKCVKKVKSMFGDDTEIGKSCSIDSDCKLPMSYALISSHKYEIKCINSECIIIDALDDLFKARCCEECKTAFSKSSIGVGVEIAMCGNFSSGQTISTGCKSFFKNNPMSVSVCESYLSQK
ncbi:hypothetical protein KAI92_03400 [Candidatus Parcubacteria bacterium]|nr:hypothetical protein [Candidatus Parcubacteria bacterium]